MFQKTSIMATTMVVAFTSLASASSHREAPFVTEQPKVDGTDFYFFRSYEADRSDYVVLVANFIPLQDPYGGPNFFNMDPNALYEIHLDNNGDAAEDLTFQFRFQTVLNDIALEIGPVGDTRTVSVPVINVGPITASDLSSSNISETYTVTLVTGDRRTGTTAAVTNVAGGGSSFVKPVDNIGNKSISDYAAYANTHIYDLDLPGSSGTGRVFVGQRKDPFVVNLAETFDLVNITNPLGAVDDEADDLADKNVTSLILELPISFITSGEQDVVGAWTTASLRQGRVLNPNPTFELPEVAGGAWVQVSRLGAPLVNEVVIGIKDKNKFNASKPADDGQFADYVTHPTLPAILELLYGSAGVQAPTLFPRTDLVAAFLTGVTDLNVNGSTSEMLRLNTTTAATSQAMQNNLGVIGGDLAGFPNGRRPGDDVVDIALRVVMGVLLGPADAPSGTLAFTDGATVDANDFDAQFPFIRALLSGSPNGTP